MRKLIWIVTGVIALSISLVLYLGSQRDGYLEDWWATHQDFGMQSFQILPGWHVEDWRGEEPRWEGLNTLRMEELSFGMSRRNALGEPVMTARCGLEELRIELRLGRGGATPWAEGRNLTLRVAGDLPVHSEQALRESALAWEEVWLEIHRFRMPLPLGMDDIRGGDTATVLEKIYAPIRETGRLPSGTVLQGNLAVLLGEGVVMRFDLGTRMVDEWLYPAIPEEQLGFAAGQIGLRLNEAEQELLSRYPFRLPVLFAIQAYAENVSRLTAERIDQFPRDAYRHLVWSYLLAREYGAEFARLVTDAHEVGETGNTPEKTAMDLHNNALGIELAVQGVPFQRLRGIAQSDPRVRRRPSGI